MSVPKERVRRRVAAGGEKAVRPRRPDPNRTRLLFGPTARALGRGQAYLAVYELVVPFVAAGFTDQISLAAGTVLLPGAFGRLFYVAPKVTLFERRDLAVALGGIGFGVFMDDDEATAGIGYGAVTYGGSERSLTAGAGFAFAEGEVASGAVLTLGGDVQVGPALKLLTENYLIPFERTTVACPLEPPCIEERRTEYEVLLSAGTRFFGGEAATVAVDFALWTSPALFGGTAFPFLPWVGIAYNFRN